MLSIIGLVAVVILTYHAYKNAKNNGRNAVGWAALTFAVGVGMQIILPMIIGVAIAIAMAASGSSVIEIEKFLQNIAAIIGIVGLILSIVLMWLIMRHISKIPENDFAPPPPPPTFDVK